MKISRKNIRTHNPCSEKWENMQDSSTGKFCEKCAKNIIDFTDKSNEKVLDIFNNDNNKDICGRISVTHFSKIATGFILTTNLTLGQVPPVTNTPTYFSHSINTAFTKVSGRLIFEDNGKIIKDAEVFFISKEKYIRTVSDEEGYFEIEIPQEFIKNKNVLYFCFNKVNDDIRKNPTILPPNKAGGNTYEDQSVIFTKDENINKKDFLIKSERFYIGGVYITSIKPPNYYYFNGKNISRRKFKKLRTENPAYQYFIFESNLISKVISNKNYLDYLYLLFSD